MRDVKSLRTQGSQIMNITTSGMYVSLNELYYMYQNGELVISKNFQRMFHWTQERQSLFMESLILERPKLSIFVLQTDYGIYELIDGLQRIATYLRFRGEQIGDQPAPLVLRDCRKAPEINNKSFPGLPKEMQNIIKRICVEMEVVIMEKVRMEEAVMREAGMKPTGNKARDL